MIGQKNRGKMIVEQNPSHETASELKFTVLRPILNMLTSSAEVSFSKPQPLALGLQAVHKYFADSRRLMTRL